ncbi:MAG: winged helix DNA-binding domain-containing protein [Jiangellaceae bacterium]
MPPEIDRRSVLAHRMAVQHLAEPVPAAVNCRLLGLGIQNTPPGSALIALSVRTTEEPQTVGGLLDADGPLAVVLAARGAPHVVSRSKLPLLAAALYPVDDREAAEIDEVSSAMRVIADGGPISRPALSAALNERVSDSLRGWCERCQSRHVYEGLFRRASLHAGLEIDAAASPTVFRPSAVDPAAAPDRERARAELARRYVHITGVARPAELAAWLGYQAADVKPAWESLADELTRCEVAGTRRWALVSDMDSLSGNAQRPEGVTLLPPSDPYLLGHRELVLPRRELQRRVWRPVGSPGVILLDGEIAGTWRHRIGGRRLHVALYPFHGLSATVVEDLTRDAE